MTEIAVRSECAAMVLKLNVAVGDSVRVDQELLILESMKTEIPVPSPAAGRVKLIAIAEGDTIAERQALVVLEI
jgi:acetyl-CoA carboxylase biotin carboxyl carrier protein